MGVLEPDIGRRSTVCINGLNCTIEVLELPRNPVLVVDVHYLNRTTQALEQDWLYDRPDVPAFESPQRSWNM